MPITRRQLNRTTLQRQSLLERRRSSLPEAVRRLTALQAQEPASPYLALWNRVDGFDPAALDRAFSSGEIVKASLMRITLHAVDARDYPGFHAAMLPSLRASRLDDRRFRESGLTVAAVDAHEEALLAASTQPRTGAQMIEALKGPFGERARSAWWAYRTYAAFHHAPTGGPWTFGQRPAFRAAPSTLPKESHEPGIDSLVQRYLESFGPATVADIAGFSLLTRGAVREALARFRDAVTRLAGPDDEELYDVADGRVAGEGAAPPRLLPMWDSVLLAYADRSRIIPVEYRRAVIRRNGDVLPTLLVDGYVVGVWRLVDGSIEASAFRPLSTAAWAGLRQEAVDLLDLLRERDPAVYGRYSRWWRDLPSAEVRLLPG